MVHSTAHGRVLYSALVENASLAALVLVTELSRDNVRDNLVLSMRMQRPNSARAQNIIIQNTKITETIVQRTIVGVEGKMPTTTKSPILYPT